MIQISAQNLNLLYDALDQLRLEDVADVQRSLHDTSLVNVIALTDDQETALVEMLVELGVNRSAIKH